jgi:hypothetical protein
MAFECLISLSLPVWSFFFYFTLPFDLFSPGGFLLFLPELAVMSYRRNLFLFLKPTFLIFLSLINSGTRQGEVQAIRTKYPSKIPVSDNQTLISYFAFTLI